MTNNATATQAPGRRLYRDKENGKISGVCAGIADYFGFDLTLTRIVCVLGLLLFPPTVFFGYFVLAWLLPKKPYTPPGSVDPNLASLQRHVRSEPHGALSHVRYRFRELDKRLQRLEKYVTSESFKLDTEFRTLQEEQQP